jgi:hypothetical protein
MTRGLPLIAGISGLLLPLTHCVRYVNVEQAPVALASPFQLLSSGTDPEVSQDRHCMLMELKLLVQVAANSSPQPLGVKIELEDYRGKIKPARLTPRELASNGGKPRPLELHYRAFSSSPLEGGSATDLDDVCRRFYELPPNPCDQRRSTSEPTCTMLGAPDEDDQHVDARLFLLIRDDEPRREGSRAFPPQMNRGDALRLSLGLPGKRLEPVADLRLVSKAGAITSIGVGGGLIFLFTIVLLL